MSVSNVSNSPATNTYANTATQTASAAAQTESKAKPAEDKVNDKANGKSKDKTNENTAAVYEKGNSKTTSANMANINRMIEESNQKVNSMKELLKGLLNTQAEKDAKAKGVSTASALRTLNQRIASGKDVMVEVSDEVRAKAAEEVSEDGYYGVKKTSERILDFAKALVEASGNDPKMIDKMEKAVKEGFKQAADIWGKEKMPQITQDTYDAVMKGFSDWKESLGISTK